LENSFHRKNKGNIFRLNICLTQLYRPYSNGILGWGGEIAASEREVEQPEPAFLFTRELFYNNGKIVKFAPDQKDAVTSMKFVLLKV